LHNGASNFDFELKDDIGTYEDSNNDMDVDKTEINTQNASGFENLIMKLFVLLFAVWLTCRRRKYSWEFIPPDPRLDVVKTMLKSVHPDKAKKKVSGKQGSISSQLA
jgi:hypothetical protein